MNPTDVLGAQVSRAPEGSREVSDVTRETRAHGVAKRSAEGPRLPRGCFRAPTPALRMLAPLFIGCGLLW